MSEETQFVDAQSVGRAEKTYAALREAILENALKPAMRLPEDALGAHFGVSRTLIRAALARLAAEGLVEVGKTKSATVASPSRADAQEAFLVRRALEREAVRILALNWSDELGEVLEEHLLAEQRAAEDGNHKLSVRLGAEFHILLAERSGNALLHRYVREVVSRCSLILTVFGQAHPQQDSLDEHRQLLEALRQGDARRADDILDAHIRAVAQRALDVPEPQEDLPLGEILRPYTRQ
jgi:DNA-binding GntR family transcriptional regulator